MFKQLVDGVWVAGQLQIEDFAAVARAGISTVINNRPDGEAPDQLPHLRAAEAAAASGLAYHHVPIGHGGLSPEIVDATRAILAEADGPVLAYCRSGFRSTVAWAFASADRLSPDEIAAAARAAGFDISGFTSQLRMLHRD